MKKGSKLADRILTNLGVQEDSTSIVNQLKATIEEFAEEAEETLTDMYNVGEETVDTFYVKGKITPLHIDLTAVHATVPKIPGSTGLPEDRLHIPWPKPDVPRKVDRMCCQPNTLSRCSSAHSLTI